MTSAEDLPDPATRKRILAAMKRRDRDFVNAVVEGYPVVRRALARRESYALIERREPKQSAKDPVGWVAVETNARFVNGIVRFVKELGIHGDYRIVSVKRRVRIASDGAEPVVELAVPRSKPLYELERWCGSPTPSVEEWAGANGFSSMAHRRIGRMPWHYYTNTRARARIG